YLHHRARAGRLGGLPGDYERRDTLTSLTMGTASLLVPLVAPTLLAPITPGKGRHGKKLVAGVAAAVAVTTAADIAARRLDGEPSHVDETDLGSPGPRRNGATLAAVDEAPVEAQPRSSRRR